MFKVDLHTHSTASPDGGLTLAHYERALSSGTLQMIAITDHNTIDFAKMAQKKLGRSIIVGEEIMTAEGEIIGLFLQDTIAPQQSLEATIAAIRAQHGIVYVPHPFETVRKGLSEQALARIATDVDLIETYNGRAMQRTARKKAAAWAERYGVAGVTSSDAHGNRGWGRTYTSIGAALTQANVVDVFIKTQHAQKNVGIIGRMYPTIHRATKRIQK
jgi:predicted metal-dependent phosphoesterase TrpH